LQLGDFIPIRFCLMKLRIHSIRTLLTLLLVAIFVWGRAASQDNPPKPAANGRPAAISRVRVLLNEESPALEITSTKPVVPSIKKEDDPLRLVITLPNTNISIPNKQIKVNAKEISAIDLDRQLALHIGSHRITPATVRVIVHLNEPCSYTWDATGNRLMVRLHRETKEVTATPPTVSTLTNVSEPVAVPVSPASAPKAILASLIPSGASIHASKQPVVLRLARGGEIQVCPGTSVVLSRSQDNASLMLGMGTGAIETSYAVENSTDSILTPDFRVYLRGPGEFHYAIAADSQGNTCVRDLPGNTAPAEVVELMGNGVYDLKLGEHVTFRSGRVDTADNRLPANCGCAAAESPIPTELPPPEENTKLASLTPPQPGELPPARSKPQDPTAAEPDRTGAAAVTAKAPKKETIQLDMAAPLVYRATPVTPPAPKAAPDAKNMPLAYSAPPSMGQDLSEAQPPPPPTPASKPKRGFFGRIKGVMAKIFR